MSSCPLPAAPGTPAREGIATTAKEFNAWTDKDTLLDLLFCVIDK